jgi:hypothetical protein
LVAAYTAIAPNFDQPFVSYGFASAVIFLVVAGCSRVHWTVAVIAAVGFGLGHAFLAQGANVAAPSLALYAGMLGRGGMVVLGWRTIWASSKERQSLLRISRLPIAIVLFVLASLVALNLITVAGSRTLDSYLYVFDGSLGFQPSFLLGQLFSQYPLVADLARNSYFALPLVIALASAGYLKHSSPWRLLGILASAGMIGYLLYFVFPAAGPRYFAGSSFPGSPQSFATLLEMHPGLIAVRISEPRNAVPSLHMAWALLLWFNSRTLSRATRGLTVTYVALTIIATLGTGEHYLADLGVALPFSVGVQAIWSPVQRTARYAVLASVAGITLAWLVALRYGTDLFLLSPAIPWGWITASTIGSLLLEKLLRSK